MRHRTDSAEAYRDAATADLGAGPFRGLLQRHHRGRACGDGGRSPRSSSCDAQSSDLALAKPAARRAASTAVRAGHPARWSSTRPQACIRA